MPPISQAPGFPPACPDWCPFDGWVMMAGLMTYALIATATLLALALLIAFEHEHKVSHNLWGTFWGSGHHAPTLQHSLT